MSRLVMLGPVTGYHSYPTVMQGLLRGLCHFGIDPEVADISSTGGPHAGGALDHLRILWLGAKGTVRVSGGEVDKGDVLFALNPTVMCAKRCVERGGRLIGMHVGDVDMLPADWIEVIKREELTVVPSIWMEDVVRSQVPTANVLVAPHGVGPAFRKRGPYVQSSVKLLHFCSSMYYPERKGTPQLLEAITRLVKRGEQLSLTMVVPMLTKPLRRLLGGMDVEAREVVLVVQRPEGMPAEDVVESYLGCEALVAPSRAEGFGMQPLEARACGRPVVQTLCTGMADHFGPDEHPSSWGVVQVCNGELQPAWGDFGRAPEVTVDAVEEALATFLQRRHELGRVAMDRAAIVGACWAWEVSTAQLAGRLEVML